ncbi:MAG: hypothetical protein ACYST6_08435 [Planctomycetota bacterium]|jgi:hypothetical protein
MQEKKRLILLICLEIISLAIMIPIIYCGTIKLFFGPIDDAFYPYERRLIPVWMVFIAILLLNVLWIILMRLCPRDTIHVKVVLTSLVLVLSAAVLSCFVVLGALEGAFS